MNENRISTYPKFQPVLSAPSTVRSPHLRFRGAPFRGYSQAHFCSRDERVGLFCGACIVCARALAFPAPPALSYAKSCSLSSCLPACLSSLCSADVFSSFLLPHGSLAGRLLYSLSLFSRFPSRVRAVHQVVAVRTATNVRSVISASEKVVSIRRVRAPASTSFARRMRGELKPARTLRARRKIIERISNVDEPSEPGNVIISPGRDARLPCP